MDDVRQNAQDVIDWFRKYPSSLVILLVFLIIILTVPTMMFQVQEYEKGVILRFGKYDRTVGSGYRLKWPYPIEKKYVIQYDKQMIEDFGIRTDPLERRQVSSKQLDQESLMLTGDLGVARVEWQIRYRKEKPKKIVFNVKNARNIIRETSLSTMRRVVGDMFVKTVITTGRGRIERKVREELQTVLDQYNTGIVIDAVDLKATEPPVPRVQAAYKEVDSARQEKETMIDKAEQKSRRERQEIEGTYEQRIAEAKGKAAQIVNRAEGEAKRFNEMVKQYQAAPKITRTRMYLETLQGVMNESDRVYVIDGQVKGLLPHLNLRKNDK